MTLSRLLASLQTRSQGTKRGSRSLAACCCSSVNEMLWEQVRTGRTFITFRVAGCSIRAICHDPAASELKVPCCSAAHAAWFPPALVESAGPKRKAHVWDLAAWICHPTVLFLQRLGAPSSRRQPCGPGVLCAASGKLRAATHLACPGLGLKWRNKTHLWVGMDPVFPLDTGTDAVLQCLGKFWNTRSIAVCLREMD